MSYYRIVHDKWAGFEVQVWRWWFPFWVQAGFSNTHPTVERAEAYATNHSQKVAKYLGKLP